MVQNLPRPNIDMVVTPSEPIHWGVTAAQQAQTAEAASPAELQLLPGQRVDLTVCLHNNGRQPVDMQLALQGQFPTRWFTPDAPWLQSSQERQQFTSLAFQLEPSQTLYRPLSFTLPEDFFEDSQALAQQSSLMLQYSCELLLYSSSPDGEPTGLVGYHPFELHARPSRVYLDFLPGIYQDSDFLGRFLSICEQALEPSFEMADLFWAYLNPRTAPKALVPFLAHWVAWPMNPKWTLHQQRKLIRHAVEIYQWRGTKKGLQLCLHLCTGLPLDDHHIQIQDADEAGFVLGEDIPLSATPCLGGGKPYHFSVTLRPESPEQAQYLQGETSTLHALIEQEKPAFCTYKLVISIGD